MTLGLLVAVLLGADSLMGQPVITYQPPDRAVLLNEPAILRVDAEGGANLRVQWRRENGTLVGSGNAYTIPRVNAGSQGGYYAVAIDATGSSTSRVATLTVHTPVTLIPMQSRWRYDASGNPPAADWASFEYNDSGWPEGQSLLHNEPATLTDPKRTLVTLTNAGGMRIRVHYFRAKFNFTGPKPAYLIANAYVDDGAVFYLNGVEAARLRLPNGPISAEMEASEAREARTDLLAFSGEALVEGANVLAVAVHQHLESEADMVFGMSLAGAAGPPQMPDLLVWPPGKPHFEERLFAEADCAVQEGMVRAGLRRLIRFETQARNAGTGDLVMGDPEGNPEFEFHACHGHHHYRDYVQYRLLDALGQEVTDGGKASFALEDSDRWEPIEANPDPRYNVVNSGIQYGWADIYSYLIPGQWIDVTGVPPGKYQLEIEIDPSRKIAELVETNNITRIEVEIPPVWPVCAGPPANDAFAKAEEIPQAVASVRGNSECATRELSEPMLRDREFYLGDKSIWYRWKASATGTLRLDTEGSNFPTMLAVYEGTNVARLTLVASDRFYSGAGHAARLTAPITAGTEYHIYLGGPYTTGLGINQAAAGEVVLNVNRNGNDLFANAVAIGGAAGMVGGTTRDATREPGEPEHAAGGTRSVWYRWTAPAGGATMFAVAGSDFQSLFTIYTGAWGNLVRVASSTQPILEAEANSTYWIAVEGEQAGGGYFELTWQSSLRFEPPRISGGEIQFAAVLPPNSAVALEKSSDLRTWSLVRQIETAGGLQSFSEPISSEALFYRLRVP